MEYTAIVMIVIIWRSRITIVIIRERYSVQRKKRKKYKNVSARCSSSKVKEKFDTSRGITMGV